MNPATRVRIVGSNGAESEVDYPFVEPYRKNFEYLMAQRLIEVHEITDEDHSTPAEISRRVIRRPSPRDIADLQ